MKFTFSSGQIPSFEIVACNFTRYLWRSHKKGYRNWQEKTHENAGAWKMGNSLRLHIFFATLWFFFIAGNVWGRTITNERKKDGKQKLKLNKKCILESPGFEPTTCLVAKRSFFQKLRDGKLYFLTFPADFYIPIIFSNLNYNCSIF